VLASESAGDEQSEGDEAERHDFSFRGVTGGICAVIWRMEMAKMGYMLYKIYFFAAQLTSQKSVEVLNKFRNSWI